MVIISASLPFSSPALSSFRASSCRPWAPVPSVTKFTCCASAPPPPPLLPRVVGYGAFARVPVERQWRGEHNEVFNVHVC